jgi:hypothetical protein
MNRPAQPSVPTPIGGVSRGKAKTEAPMARLGPLMRATDGASRELAALRRRARRLRTKNAQLRREIERLHHRLEARPAGPDDHRATAPAR